MTRLMFVVMMVIYATSTFVIADQDIRVQRVQFEGEENSTIIESSIKGYVIVDYVLGAQQGQYMNVSMATDNRANYFNIMAPGEDQVAMFNGSMNENQYEGLLPDSGNYKIRVYMMRSAARRNEVANFRLEMIITSARLPKEDSTHKK